MGDTLEPEFPKSYEINGEKIAVEILTKSNPENMSLVKIAREIAGNTLTLFGLPNDPDHEIIEHALRKRNQGLYIELKSREQN